MSLFSVTDFKSLLKDKINFWAHFPRGKCFKTYWVW